MNVTSRTDICENCLSEARTLETGFIASLKTNPGYETEHYVSADQLMADVRADKLFSALARTKDGQDVRFLMERLEKSSPEQVEQYVFESLASRLPCDNCGR